MIDLARKANIINPRVLELGAYAHHSAQIVANELGGTAVSHDISARSLAVGQARACELGLYVDHVAVAGDFHSLPFETGSFDITFIASAVHHTWRPWMVMEEMVRVTRPGGIIHLENEPVGRAACLYHFRSNRADQFTDFERKLDEAGLLHTLVSPFPGSRDEKLFGIIENDRITLELFEKSLLGVGHALEWRLDTGSVINDFERWLLEARPSAGAIGEAIKAGVESARAAFDDVAVACDFSLPTDDQIWPLAYRLEAALTATAVTDDREIARLFGAALRATVVKNGKGLRVGQIFSRKLRENGGVLIDDAAATAEQVNFANILPAPHEGDFGPDWHVMLEENGIYTLCNKLSDCIIPIDLGEGFLILRAYSVKTENPYYFSVMRNNELIYSHGVARSESHLAKIFVMPGDCVSIHHHGYDGLPVDVPFHTRLIPQFVPTA